MLDQTAVAVVEEGYTPDPESFAQLVRENQAMVFSLALHSLRDPSLAEEIAQDVFLELHRRLSSLESRQHVRNWLRKVTANRCIDQSRRRRVRPQVALEEVAEPAAPPGHDDPMRDALLRRLVAVLPEKDRMIVILRYQEDLGLEEIAATLDMPVRAVKAHLHKGLETLRGKLSRVMETRRER